MHLSMKTLFASLLGATVLASPLPSNALVERNAPLNEFLSILLSHLPAINGSITAVSGLITDFDQVLADLTGAQTTQNQYIGVCTEYTVLFARGTSEPGNVSLLVLRSGSVFNLAQVGVLVGPPLYEAFEEAVGSRALTFQGVNGYSASVESYLAGGDAAGSKSMYVSSAMFRNHLATFQCKIVTGADTGRTGHPTPPRFSQSVPTPSSS